jgi:hypothetical protein
MNELCRMLLPLSHVFLFFKEQQSESSQLYASIIISIMRSMDASHFEILFDTPPYAGITTINQLIQLSLNSNSYSHISAIDDAINKSIIKLKNITSEDSIAQLTVVKLIHTCKTLIEDSTFPKGILVFI